MSLPSKQQVRLAPQSPQIYVVRVETYNARDYVVPSDGRLTLDIPAFRRGDSVYLFDRIRINGGTDPSKTWAIRIVSNGKTVRTLSLKELSSLPVDAEGYHILEIPN